jgi:hypothetical protein
MLFFSVRWVVIFITTQMFTSQKCALEKLIKTCAALIREACSAPIYTHTNNKKPKSTPQARRIQIKRHALRLIFAKSQIMPLIIAGWGYANSARDLIKSACGGYIIIIKTGTRRRKIRRRRGGRWCGSGRGMDAARAGDLICATRWAECGGN